MLTRRRPWPMRVLLLISVLAWVQALSGCATAPPRPEVPVPTPAAVPRPAVAATSRTAQSEVLAVERQWLASWFEGTPVVVNQAADGSVTVLVPRVHCFDVGQVRIKPALQMVLDKVAESLRRRPGHRLLVLAAPDDHAPTRSLALQRATQLRRHLQDRGVPIQRLAEPSSRVGDAVLLHMAAA